MISKQPALERVDVDALVMDIRADFSIDTRRRRPGPPRRTDAVTMGVVDVAGAPPHAGEMHPDGDEILFVISGRLRITGDSAPDAPLELGPGQACIVRRGEWHQLDVIEPARLVHLTPGPNGDHRPLPQD